MRANKSLLLAGLLVAALPYTLACGGDGDARDAQESGIEAGRAQEAGAEAEGHAVHWGYEEPDGPRQ